MSKKTTSSFKTGLSNLGRGSSSGMRRDNALRGFTSSGLTFGKPSSLKGLTPASDAGTDWSGIAKQFSSGGGASLLHKSSASAGFGGFGLSSIVSGIASLFGAGSKQPLPPLQLFPLPEAVNRTVNLQHGQSGASAGSTVHVHVQATDSQSFLTRSNDIAKAVKTAMLNSHSLNDIVSEL
jgi:hypothetical protein